MKTLLLLIGLFAFVPAAESKDYAFLEWTNTSTPERQRENSREIAYGIDYIPIAWLALFEREDVQAVDLMGRKKMHKVATAIVDKATAVGRLKTRLSTIKKMCPIDTHAALDTLLERIADAPGGYIQMQLSDIDWIVSSPDSVADVRHMTKAYHSKRVKSWALLLSQAQIRFGRSLDTLEFEPELELRENSCSGHFD